MIDIAREIAATRRELGTGQFAAGEGRAIRLERTYDAPIDEVWDALTSFERISRWFLPISGESRVGGQYQLEGNAGGEILACDRPARIRVSWVFGVPASPRDVSEVEIRLTPAGERTTVVLEHIGLVPDEMWDQFGPGALGAGWDGGVLGLALHLRGGTVGDPIAWQLSDEGRAYVTRSSEAWGEAHAASGAEAETVARTVANTIAFYTTVPEESPATSA